MTPMDFTVRGLYFLTQTQNERRARRDWRVGRGNPAVGPLVEVSSQPPQRSARGLIVLQTPAATVSFVRGQVVVEVAAALAHHDVGAGNRRPTPSP
jgi:hypothetical protein